MKLKSKQGNPFVFITVVIATILASSFAFAADSKEDKMKMMDKEMMSKEGNNIVVEIATFNLKKGVTVEEFRKLDKAVEVQHVSKQPGFISRESAAGENGEWLVVVHWKTVKDAEASMASFSNAPAAAEFMSKLDVNSMSMKRYNK